MVLPGYRERMSGDSVDSFFFSLCPATSEAAIGAQLQLQASQRLFNCSFDIVYKSDTTVSFYAQLSSPSPLLLFFSHELAV